jgi:hypothetical protein
MSTTRQSLEDIEVKTTGAEPKFSQLTTLSQLEMSKTLTWYTQNRDGKFAYKSIAEYVKKHKLSVSQEAINNQTTTFGFICRMLDRGAHLTDKHQQWFDERLKSMTSFVNTKNDVETPVDTNTNVISIQDRIAEKTSEIAGELEGAIDDYINSDFTKSSSPYAIMQDKVKGVHATKILEIFKRRRAQFDEALSTNDEQLIEAWSCYNKSQLKKLVAFCDTIITDAMKFLQASSQSRKPRKRKQKTPEQLIAKLNYQEAYAPSDLKSEDPKKIIGAQQLWVYNTKTKKLGVYQAEDASGLSIKGSTIINHSESKSITKTLRKPDEVIPQVVKGGKVYLRNVLSELTTKESLLNGRINTDTILLKIL